ncbi:MAG: GAF domain-containing sensor histidine kinase [Bacteroidota bacterium]|nr:GAF domain-containing sensor histidine kinase [Bacteroidota bacterium]
MPETSNSSNEKEHLSALREYRMEEMQDGKEFEELALLASEICQTPVSLITLTDGEKQWFKAVADMQVDSVSRCLAFCAQIVCQTNHPFIISDMRKDKRFADQSFVAGNLCLVFYAGFPLTNVDGYVMGTLCVSDMKPKTLSDDQVHSLQILAKQAVRLLELRKANLSLKSLKELLESKNEEMQKFAYVVSHDIKSPLSSIVLSGEMIRENFGDSIDEGNDQLLRVLNRAAFKIRDLVDGILSFYRAEQALSEKSKSFGLQPFLLSIVEMLKMGQDADIIFPKEEVEVFMNKNALEQILINLLQNALKYNDKEKPRIAIHFSEDETNYYFTVADNGNGIDGSVQKKISEMFTASADVSNRFGFTGVGVGLSTIKKLLEKMNGEIKIKSVPGQGSEFSFSIKKGKANASHIITL